MTSKKKILSNRENAKKSTGPQTAEGKRAVRGNKVKHGLRSSTILIIKGEDEDEFDEFRANIAADLNASGTLEEEIADRIAVQLWRVRRIPAIEAAMLGDAGDRGELLLPYGGSEGSTSLGVAIGFDFSASHNFYSTLCVYESTILNNLTKSYRLLQEIQQARSLDFQQSNPN